jgi:hypothetical protein
MAEGMVWVWMECKGERHPDTPHEKRVFFGKSMHPQSEINTFERHKKNSP